MGPTHRWRVALGGEKLSYYITDFVYEAQKHLQKYTCQTPFGKMW